MSAERRNDELQETIAPVSAEPDAGDVRMSGTVELTSLPAVSRSGNQVTLTSRNEIRYRNESVLGRGGMGEVQLANDQDIGRRVAVKRLLNQKNPQSVARFIDEVRTVGKLEHPNIVPIHDVGVDADGSLFFVMKYVDGETLASIIGRLREGDVAYHKRYRFEARLDLFSGLMRALQYAHEQGMLHRDVKPENIMVGHFGEVMLTDWGIARHVNYNEGSSSDDAKSAGEMPRASGQTMDGSIIGTIGYMSPEQASGRSEEIDERSDLYAAFVVLYELLSTRSFVQRGDSLMKAITDAKKRQAPQFLDPNYDSRYQPAVPAELRHFLRRGLQPLKADRFQNADDVLRDLERIRSGEPPIQCAGTLIKVANARLERLVDKHPLLAISLYATTACVFLIGIVTTCMVIVARWSPT